MNQPAQVHQHPGQQTPFQMMATRLSVDPDTVQNLMTQTLMKAKGGQQQVTHEELMVFMSIANEYRLNPLAKEIYAFNNRGAIQPIVSIDGWLKIINTHPQFDGMEFDDRLDNQGKLLAITCRIFRKDRSRATEVTEYLSECAGATEPWKKWPVRMLRHKATIQCARYAFGLSGIIDEDEADRYRSTNLERDVTPQKDEPETLPFYPAEQFEDNFPTWQAAIEAGKRTPEQVIGFLTSKAQLTNEQKQQILEVAA
ncbi:MULTISPECIES: recombinase RecT [Halomonas]|uniref:recombinase RecT n=1 Tax=Halomonas TaxID=2745 RepID=UPI001C97449F|nr:MULTISPECIES: recombinase RecT [Halomonas]MBY6208727.1 recombinase RecT [Halomonas sp. DP3Y7-2]MBY6227198.1 recombinase RecT [Halomonas sp. DP3Y7-1]MCA0915053.1 recombinase RecT [Halomonas denitrificans]